MSLPHITAVYRLATDPRLESHYVPATNSHMAVLRLRLAASASRFDRDTQKWETTARLFVDAELIDNGAAALAPQLTKGSQVTVTGELVTDEWRTKTGEIRSRIKIKARRVHVHRATDDANTTATGTGTAATEEPPF